jgi:leucyl aminopeptidase
MFSKLGVPFLFHVQPQLDLQGYIETLVVGLFQKNQPLTGIIKQLDDKLDGHLLTLIKTGDISTKKKEITKFFPLGKLNIKRIYFVGLGKRKQLDNELRKEIFGKVFQTIQEAKIQRLAIALDTFVQEESELLEAALSLGEAFPLSTYKIKDYKHKSNGADKQIEEITVIAEKNLEGIQKNLSIGFVYGKGTNLARTLVNMPSNLLTAAELSRYAFDLAQKYHFDIEIIEKETMEKIGMGGILAVNKGSDEPPKMIVLKYQGKENWEDVIALVGKGITYDSGGYSLKPRDGLVNMKTDMAGAAAVLGAMEIIGEQRPAQNVVAVIPATDNMISGSSMKPDDVITSLSGKTIEILNTDAEGRLALADAITYAKHHKADYIIDVATLTGGIVVALGTHTTGAMTNHEGMFAQFLKASKQCGERIWQLPIIDKDLERVRNSKMADLNNSPGREGHAIMAGAFLAEFAENTPWIHLDIAGTATTSNGSSLGPKGATGVMTRTLAFFVENFKPMK